MFRKAKAICGGTLGCLLFSHASNVEAVVEIDGLDPDLRSNVLALLSLDEEECAAPERRIEAEVDRADADIALALEAYGYYDPSIDSTLTFSEECWLARFSVMPGERVLLRDVSIELRGDATMDEAFSSVLAGTSLQPMQPLFHRDYDALKQMLRSLAVERGYREARFEEASIDVYPEQLAADVRILFDSGPRYRFGEIVLDQDVVSSELFVRYIEVESGEDYDNRQLADARLVLMNSGYFNTVSVEPGTPNRETHEIPVVIRVTPAARAEASYGFGISTDTGPRFRFSRTIRRVNRSGHQIDFNGLLSPVVVEASANYRMPYGDPRSEWVSFDIGVLREETDTSTSRSFQFGARRVVLQAELWTRTDALSMLVEDFDVGSQSGRARLLMPGVAWTRLDADDAIRPNRGSRLRFTMRGASDSLASNASFMQLVVAGKWIWPLPRSSRLLVSASAGRLWYDVFEDLPPSVRFFAGGDNSVRGYRFETLGPVNELGEVIGGSRLLTGSVEIEKQLKPAWSVALFADTGNAFASSNPDLHSSIGIGARWQSPLGPVRFDIAEPLDGIDRNTQIHISLGPDL